MTKLISAVIFALSLSVALPGASRADYGLASDETVNANTWKEMQRVHGIIAAELKTHRKDGTNPKFFFAPAETTLSYRLIVVVAYEKPRTLEEAKAAAKKDGALGIDVLAKALLEYNRRAGIEDSLVCLAATCKKRRVEIALTQEGLGIHDAPIKRDIEYSTRVVYP